LSPYVAEVLKIGDIKYIFRNKIEPKIYNNIKYNYIENKLILEGTNFLYGNTITIVFNKNNLEIKDNKIIYNCSNIITTDLNVEYSQNKITIYNIKLSKYTSYSIYIRNPNNLTSNTINF